VLTTTAVVQHYGLYARQAKPLSNGAAQAGSQRRHEAAPTEVLRQGYTSVAGGGSVFYTDETGCTRRARET